MNVKHEKMEKLLDIVRNAKNALFKTWEESEKSFYDKNKMPQSGILSESIGLVSLLVLVNSFADNENVFSEEDLRTMAEIIKETVAKIERLYDESGFSAAPIVPSKETEMIFTKENGYLETVTWIFSMSVFVRYIERKHTLDLDDHTVNTCKKLLAITFKQIVDAQRDDGTWGCMIDKNSSKSIYYTYSAGISIADFLDFILGELDEDERLEAGIDLDIDNEILDYLKSELGYDPKEKIFEVRAKLQDWLIHDCLPLLPTIARCKVLTAEEQDMLGIEGHVKFDLDNLGWFNLYYVYYLIELMVSMKTDKRYDAMVMAAYPELFDEKELKSNSLKESGDALKNLKNYYSSKKLMNSINSAYYFGSDYDNADSYPRDLWKGLLEEAIHTSRANYMSASRTGDEFWNQAEIEIPWKHDTNDALNKALRKFNLKHNNIDPTITPAALRANIFYSYYISEQTDLAIDRLFFDICDQVGDVDDDKHRKDLWDGVAYNLFLTERSIESLADYYDYLLKFDVPVADASEHIARAPKDAAENVVVEKAAPMTVDEAIEAKIAEYLASDKGKEIIDRRVAEYVAAEACKAVVSPTAASEEITKQDIDKFARLLDIVRLRLKETDDVKEDSDNNLLETLNQLMKIVMSDYFYRIARKNAKSKEIADKNFNTFKDQCDLLMKEIFRGEKIQNTDWASVYLKVIANPTGNKN